MWIKTSGWDKFAYIIVFSLLLLAGILDVFAQQSLLLFQEDFEGDLDVWELGSNWDVHRDESGNHVLAGGPGPEWALLKIGQEWTDYVINFRVRMEPGIQLMTNFRATPIDRWYNSYFVGLNENYGTAINKGYPAEVRFVNLQDAYLNTSPADGEWHTVTIRAVGPRLQVAFDGEDVIDVEDWEGEPFLNGSLGFNTVMRQDGEESYVYIDDIVIQRIDPPPYIFEDGTLDTDHLIQEIERNIAQAQGYAQSFQSWRNPETGQRAADSYQATLDLIAEYEDHEALAGQSEQLQMLDYQASVGMGLLSYRFATEGGPRQADRIANRETLFLDDPAEAAGIFDFSGEVRDLLEQSFDDPRAGHALLEAAGDIDDETRARLEGVFYLLEAGQAYEDGDWDGANEVLDRAERLQWAFETPTAYHYYRARIHEAENRLFDAYDHWSGLFESYPRRIVLMDLRAKWYDQAEGALNAFAKDLERAKERLDDAIHLAEELPSPPPYELGQVYFTLGQLYRTTGDILPDMVMPSGTLSSWIRTRGAGQSAFMSAAETFESGGLTWWQAESLKEAAFLQRQIADSDEIFQHMDPYEWYRLSIENAREAVRLRDDPEALATFAENAFIFAHRLEMLQVFETGADEPTDIDALLNEIITAVSSAERPEFAIIYRGIAYAKLAQRTGDTDNAWYAIQDLGPAVTSWSLEWNALQYGTHYLGRAYYLLGQYERALPHLQTASELEWDWLMPEWANTQAYYENQWMLGDSLLAVGRYEEGIASYEIVTRLRNVNPIYPKVRLGLSQAYDNLGKYAQSVSALMERRDCYSFWAEDLLRNAELSGTQPDADLLYDYRSKMIDSMLRAVTPLLVLGRTEEAFVQMQDALDLAVELDDRAILVNTRLRLGDIYLRLSDKENALTHYTEALDLAAWQAGLGQQHGRALLGIGRIQMDRGLIDEAPTTLNQALGVVQSVQDIEGEVKVWTAMGDLAMMREESDRAAAERNYRQALAIAARSTDARLAVDTLIAIASLQETAPAETAALDAAITYHEALARAENVNDREAIARIAGRLATLMVREANFEAAERYYAQAVEVVEQTQRGFHAETLQSQFTANYAWIYAGYIQMLFESGQYERAFTIAERARARAFLDQLAVGPVNFREVASGELLQQQVELHRQIEAKRILLKQAMETYKAKLSDPDYDKEAGALRVSQLKGELQDLQAEYTALFSRIQANHPAIASLTGVEVASLSEIQAALPPQSTLLSYYTAGEGTYVFIITAGDFHAAELDVTGEAIRDQIEAFRADETQTRTLKSLYEELVRPIEARMDTPRLIIVPHGYLHYLPFAALIAPDGKPLVERFAVSYLPSATTQLYFPGGREGSGEVLAFGNPQVEGLKPLKFAEQEVQTVTETAGGEAYTGTEATEALLHQRAPSASVLYIAAHGEFNERNPLFSALRLAGGDGYDGRLETHEIYSLDLTRRTELVVLSACETGAGALSAGDEFSGLSRAFLYAGAPGVVASLWRVDDEATAILMAAFFQARAGGMRDVEALRSAQQTLHSYQDEDGNTRYAAPYYWAAFVLTGGG